MGGACSEIQKLILLSDSLGNKQMPMNAEANPEETPTTSPLAFVSYHDKTQHRKPRS